MTCIEKNTMTGNYDEGDITDYRWKMMKRTLTNGHPMTLLPSVLSAKITSKPQ